MNVLISDPQQIELIRAIPEGGVGYLVVDGGQVGLDPIHPEGIWVCEGCSAIYGEYVNGCVEDHPAPRGVKLRVPESHQAEAPSPWSDLPATCRTCEGRGEYRRRSPIDGKCGWPIPCPDCVAGRPVHLLQAACPKCPERLTARFNSTCSNCNDTGVIPLGRFTVDVLPVVGWDDPSETAPLTEFVLVANGLASVHHGERWGYVTLDPLPLPGQFVVALTRVTP
jgi:hypothetical protein